MTELGTFLLEYSSPLLTVVLHPIFPIRTYDGDTVKSDRMVWQETLSSPYSCIQCQFTRACYDSKEANCSLFLACFEPCSVLQMCFPDLLPHLTQHTAILQFKVSISLREAIQWYSFVAEDSKGLRLRQISQE